MGTLSKSLNEPARARRQMEEDEIAAALVGRTIQGWRVERVLGAGGMASVVLGVRADGAEAALKILHPHLADVPELRKRFLREGPVGSALSAMGPLCSGLPRIFESGVSEGGVAYLAMEVLEGETAFDWLMRVGPLRPEDAFSLAERVLDVLVVAHAHGVVHRDIKPENLHIGATGTLKVLDFGIARVLDPLPREVGVIPDKTVTIMGALLGTSEYMAPEQAMGSIDQIEARTDIFGLGATLFRLLSGRGIHGSLEGSQLLIAAATQPAPPLASVAPQLPPAACGVVDRALAFAKSQRYPDARTMRGDVRAFLAGKQPPYITAIATGAIDEGAAL